jgi:hypothetical protein
MAIQVGDTVTVNGQGNEENEAVSRLPSPVFPPLNVRVTDLAVLLWYLDLKLPLVREA